MPSEFNEIDELERLVGEEMGQDFRDALETELAKLLAESISEELMKNGGYATWEEWLEHESTATNAI
jgi:hypothetical protein